MNPKTHYAFGLVFFLPSICAIFLLLVPACAPAPFAVFHLQSEVDLPAGIPVKLSLPEGLACCSGLGIRPVDGASSAALQSAGGNEAVFQLEADLPAGSLRQYEITEVRPETSDHILLKEGETGIEAAIGEKAIFTYNTATLMPPIGSPDHYKRSGFIHPFYSPGGKVLTDGFPVGHTHQHGIFFAWVNTTYRGDFTDFWNQHTETGTVAFRELRDTVSGPVFAGFQSTHEFLSLKHGPVLTEEWTVKAYRLPRYNLIDITSRQKMIGNDTLFINKYHYGGMAARLSAEWNNADSTHFTNPMQVLTSEGISDRDSANHSRPSWTAAYGQIGGHAAGVAMFDHPSNFRFPQPVRVHPDMPYFVLTPSVENAFTLTPRQEYVSTYRIVSFDSEPDVEALDAMWWAYSGKMMIKWVNAKIK